MIKRSCSQILKTFTLVGTLGLLHKDQKHRPNRAEAAVRTFKKQVTLMMNSLADDPALADVTYRQLVRQACLARNSSVAYGGVTPLEMAFGLDLQTS